MDAVIQQYEVEMQQFFAERNAADVKQVMSYWGEEERYSGAACSFCALAGLAVFAGVIVWAAYEIVRRCL